MKLEVSFRKVSFSFETMDLSTQNRPTCNEIRGYDSFESWYSTEYRACVSVFSDCLHPF